MFWLWFLAIVGAIFLIQWYLFRRPDGEPLVGNLNSDIDESLAGTAVSNSHFVRYASSFRTGDEEFEMENVVLKVRCVAGSSVTIRVLLYESGEDGPTGPNLIEKWPVQTWSSGQYGEIAFLRAASQKKMLRPNTTYWIAFYNNNTAGDTSAEWARTSVHGLDELGNPGVSIPSTGNFYVSGSRGEKWAPDSSGSPGMFRIYVRPVVQGTPNSKSEPRVTEVTSGGNPGKESNPRNFESVSPWQYRFHLAEVCAKQHAQPADLIALGKSLVDWIRSCEQELRIEGLGSFLAGKYPQPSRTYSQRTLEDGTIEMLEPWLSCPVDIWMDGSNGIDYELRDRLVESLENAIPRNLVHYVGIRYCI